MTKEQRGSIFKYQEQVILKHTFLKKYRIARCKNLNKIFIVCVPLGRSRTYSTQVMGACTKYCTFASVWNYTKELHIIPCSQSV
jgi:hypothetical protein